MRKDRMNVFVLFMFATVLCISAQLYGATPSSGYDVVKPDQRIPLSETGSAAGKWQAQDVSIEYRYSRDPGGLTISGILNFEDSIRYNYDRLNYLHADVIFADAQGRVIGRETILNTRQSGFERWDAEKFTRRIALPPGTTAFAFSYTGEVLEAGGGHRRGGGFSAGNATRIWAYPIIKAGTYHQPAK